MSDVPQREVARIPSQASALEGVDPQKMVDAVAKTWTANLALLEAMPEVVAGLVKDAKSSEVPIRMEARRDLLRYAQTVQNLVLYHRQQNTLASMVKGMDGPTLQLLLKLVETVKSGGKVIDAEISQ